MKSQQDHLPIELPQLRQSIVEHDVKCIRYIVGRLKAHEIRGEARVPLARNAAAFATKTFGREESSRGEQPTRDVGMFGERAGVAGERGEDQLSHVLGAMDVATDAAQCRTVNQRQIKVHQCGEGVFRSGGDIVAKLFVVVAHEGCSPVKYPTPEK